MSETKTGGRRETSSVIPGDYALSVGKPDISPPKGWSWTKLTDMARLETGHTPSRKYPEYWGGDIPWVGIKDATANHGLTIYKTNQQTNELGITNSSARVLPANTVCLSRTASVGFVIVMGEPMSTSQDFVNWVCDSEKLDYQFLKYILLSEKRSFLRFASGTTHQTIYFPEAKAFHICAPNLAEQKTIAHILGSVDDKIELNRQMNITLEAMTQALFKSWFVDFDPVIDNALAAGHAIPDLFAERAAQRKAMNKDEAINPLFPDTFKYTEEMGWIPKGWGVSNLADLTTELRRGISPKYTEEEGVKVVNQRCIREHKINFSVCRKNDVSLRKVEGRFLEVGDLLVNSTGVGTLGRMAQVTFLDEPTVVDSHVTVVRPNPEKYKPYSFAQMMISIEPHVESMGLGSTGQTELSRTDLSELKTIVPSIELQQITEDIFIQHAEKIVLNSKQNISLSKLRDTLLPKLLSGELRIPDAEKLVEEAQT